MDQGCWAQAAAAMALFILKENIHLGVCSLAATRPFRRFKYLLDQKGISLLNLHEKSPKIHYNLVLE